MSGKRRDKLMLLAVVLFAAVIAIAIPGIGAALGRLIGEIWASVLIALAGLLGGTLGH